MIVQMHTSNCGRAFVFHALQINDSYLREINSTKSDSCFSTTLQLAVLMATLVFSFTFHLPYKSPEVTTAPKKHFCFKTEQKFSCMQNKIIALISG